MRTAESFDLVVIGTGAAGMAAAIRGAELGRRVAIIEEGTVGGTCVNVGCIPSKNLIAAADHYHAARTGFAGISGCTPELDWPGVLVQKRELVERLRRTKYLDVLDSYPEVTLVRGRARLAGTGRVEVDGAVHTAPKTVIATGTRPWTPPIPGIETIPFLDSTSAMELEHPPESLLVLGGSAVGLELGQAFARFGTRVTVLEILPRILAGEEAEAAFELRRHLEAEGMEIRTSVRVSRVETVAGGVGAHLEGEGASEILRAERLLVAAGRRAETASLGLEDAGVRLDERGFIRVDAGMRTTNPDVFAAGDVTGGPGFVYVAAAAGRVAAGNALEGLDEGLDSTAIPRVTFTSPQVAGVGLMPAEAEERGIEVRVSRLGLEHVPRALVEHREGGWVKLVAAASDGRVLGVHAVGPSASELLGEAALAVRLGLPVEELVRTMHPYLTWIEGLKLAAQGFTTDVERLSCCA